MLNTLDPSPAASSRDALRQQLRLARHAFSQSPQAVEAGRSLAQALGSVLAQLEPVLLGTYWPVGAEFNAQCLWNSKPAAPDWALALPFASKNPVAMHYRPWHGEGEPATRDDCGIPSPLGPAVVPDVVLVPCLGYTREGWRLGQGGGYFDRWLNQHPGVTAVGVAWAVGELSVQAFQPQPHDRPLSVVVTELGVV